jgi:hypothetical protein
MIDDDWFGACGAGKQREGGAGDKRLQHFASTPADYQTAPWPRLNN